MFNKKKTKIDVLLNLIGNFAPVAAAFVCMPRIIVELGVERFGLLAIVWAIIGYAGVFDLGISKSLFYFGSMAKFDPKKYPLCQIFKKASLVLVVTGIVFAIIFIVFSGSISILLLDENKNVLNDGRLSFMAVGIIVPFAILSNAYRGLIEGMSKFLEASILKLIGGLMLFMAPWVSTFYINLDVYIICIEYLVVRILLTVLAVMIIKNTDEYAQSMSVINKFKGSLFSYSKNTLISSIISPLMVNGDRLVLSYFGGAANVGVYSLIQESIGRLSLFAASVSSTYQPLYTLFEKNSVETYKKSYLIWIPVMLLIFIFVAIYSVDLLTLWSGLDMNGYALIVYIYIISIFVNSIAQFPYSLLLGKGRPDLPAKFHLIEFVIYIPLIALLVMEMGMLGAAIAFLCRVCLDCILLEIFARRVLEC